MQSQRLSWVEIMVQIYLKPGVGEWMPFTPGIRGREYLGGSIAKLLKWILFFSPSKSDLFSSPINCFPGSYQ